MAQPTFYSDGNTPRINDTMLRVEQKILGAIRDFSGSGGGGGTPTTYALGGNFSGEGSPEGVVSAYPGAEYTDTLNHMIYHKVSGAGTNTGWEG